MLLDDHASVNRFDGNTSEIRVIKLLGRAIVCDSEPLVDRYFSFLYRISNGQYIIFFPSFFYIQYVCMFFLCNVTNHHGKLSALSALNFSAE